MIWPVALFMAMMASLQWKHYIRIYYITMETLHYNGDITLHWRRYITLRYIALRYTAWTSGFVHGNVGLLQWRPLHDSALDFIRLDLTTFA